jgi:hypothetical protein
MNAQRTTAEDWLMRNGPPAHFGTYDRAAVAESIAKIDRLPAAKPGRGRRQDLADRVGRDIREQLNSGSMTIPDLTRMKLEAIADQFGCSKNTASKVKDQIIAAETNSGKKREKRN